MSMAAGGQPLPSPQHLTSPHRDVTTPTIDNLAWHNCTRTAIAPTVHQLKLRVLVLANKWKLTVRDQVF